MSFEFLANILFPPVCVACRGRIAHGVVCSSCLSGIEIRESLMCGECLAPISSPLPSPPAWPQSDCHAGFPYVLGAAGHYEDTVLQSLIHHLKFRSIRGAAEPLAKLMAHYMTRTGINLANFVAIPIPLSCPRRRARGFNQSELIARHLATMLAQQNGIVLPVATDILLRTKHAKPQSETTNAAERKENIRGVYAIKNSAFARETVKDANILLIDDVSTSGATFFEASRILKSAGAKTIIALAAAKT